MTKAAAYYAFWSQFGIPAFEENSVPDGKDAPGFPRLTYQFGTDSFSDYPTALTVSVWFRDSSWVPINAKVEQISAVIGTQYGDAVPCDGGHFRVKRGSPWALRMGDENDDMIKRAVLNVSVQWNTMT